MTESFCQTEWNSLPRWQVLCVCVCARCSHRYTCCKAYKSTPGCPLTEINPYISQKEEAQWGWFQITAQLRSNCAVKGSWIKFTSLKQGDVYRRWSTIHCCTLMFYNEILSASWMTEWVYSYQVLHPDRITKEKKQKKQSSEFSCFRCKSSDVYPSQNNWCKNRMATFSSLADCRKKNVTLIQLLCFLCVHTKRLIHFNFFNQRTK